MIRDLKQKKLKRRSGKYVRKAMPNGDVGAGGRGRCSPHLAAAPNFVKIKHQAVGAVGGCPNLGYGGGNDPLGKKYRSETLRKDEIASLFHGDDLNWAAPPQAFPPVKIP